MDQVLPLRGEAWRERTYDQDYGGTLLIGCPIQNREWIIDDWYRHTIEAAREVTDDFAFIFVIDPEDPTYERICSLSDRYSVTTFFVQVEEEPPIPKARNWNEHRLHKMVFLRNLLLDGVRKVRPDMFLSLDSDMLLDRRGILVLVEQLEDFDAVGGKAWLTSTGTGNPTFGIWKGKPENGRFLRSDRDYTCKVDVLMAIKLMSPRAYCVDYKFARQGEDIGWSQNCHEAGLAFGWVGEVTNRHIMEQSKLGAKDVRFGD